MKIPGSLQVGACTHTGRVRTGNEDDYLLGHGGTGGPFVAAIADGMGGLGGGAEASRTALRAMAACVLDGGSKGPATQRLRDGFTAAAVRVSDAAQAVSALKDMGTTMTVLCLDSGAATLGHVGDTRAYRRRGSELTQLTTDHAVRQPENLLTKCIGAGQPTVDADFATLPTAPGDRFVLVSDGVWSVLSPAALAQAVGAAAPQAAAEALVARALELGGPDNATAVVVDVTAGAGEPATDVALPRDERPDDRRTWPRPWSLRPPVWPWPVLVIGLLLATHAALRQAGIDAGLWWLFQS